MITMNYNCEINCSWNLKRKYFIEKRVENVLVAVLINYLYHALLYTIIIIITTEETKLIIFQIWTHEVIDCSNNFNVERK